MSTLEKIKTAIRENGSPMDYSEIAMKTGVSSQYCYQIIRDNSFDFKITKVMSPRAHKPKHLVSLADEESTTINRIKTTILENGSSMTYKQISESVGFAMLSCYRIINNNPSLFTIKKQPRLPITTHLVSVGPTSTPNPDEADVIKIKHAILRNGRTLSIFELTHATGLSEERCRTLIKTNPEIVKYSSQPQEIKTITGKVRVFLRTAPRGKLITWTQLESCGVKERTHRAMVNLIMRNMGIEWKAVPGVGIILCDPSVACEIAERRNKRIKSEVGRTGEAIANMDPVARKLSPTDTALYRIHVFFHTVVANAIKGLGIA